MDHPNQATTPALDQSARRSNVRFNLSSISESARTYRSPVCLALCLPFSFCRTMATLTPPYIQGLKSYFPDCTEATTSYAEETAEDPIDWKKPIVCSTKIGLFANGVVTTTPSVDIDIEPKCCSYSSPPSSPPSHTLASSHQPNSQITLPKASQSKSKMPHTPLSTTTTWISTNGAAE